jgi:hypothetical protein
MLKKGASAPFFVGEIVPRSLGKSIYRQPFLGLFWGHHLLCAKAILFDVALASGYDPVFRPGRRAITTHIPLPVSAKAGRTETGRLWMYVRDEWPGAARRPLRSGSSTHRIARGQRLRLI